MVGFGGDELGGVAFGLSYRLAIFNEVIRVLMTGGGVVMSSHPVVVAVRIGMWKVLVTKLLPREEMPLAYVASVVARCFEEFRIGDLGLAQMRRAIAGEVAPDAVSIRSAASEDSRTGWRANPTGRIALHEFHSLRG